MKKILPIILLCLTSSQIQSQPYVTIPDNVFRDYIDSLVPGAIVGMDLNTSHPGLPGVTAINVMSMGISDLTGVQYFPNLTELYCANNFLTDLPPLANSISMLGCDHNQLNSLPALPIDLWWFHCDYNNLGSLPALPADINQLYCGNNFLTTLPSLPQNLNGLWSGDNDLTSLPALPPNLENLYLANNQLSSLPALPNSLTYLIASGNPDLWCLPNIPNNGSFFSDIGYLICTPQGTPDTWYKMANSSVTKIMATSFSIGAKCYLATGSSNLGSSNDLWEFNPVTNAWTQKANLPAAGRLQATSFSIGNRGYLGLGQGGNPAALRDFWEYNPVSNSWLQKADYPDSAFFGNAAFSIGNKGYVGCGLRSGSVFPTTFFEFDPVANTWTSKANFPGVGRTQAACFTIGNKGYVCGGDWSNGLTNTCYSYNPSTNSWTSIATLPQNINEAASFSSNGKGYVSCGQCCFWNGTLVTTLEEYDPALNTWTQRADIPTLGRFRTTGCSAGGRGYVGTGEIYTSGGSSTKTNDWWEYTPICTTPSDVIYASGNTTFCDGDSVMLFADNGNKYKWKKNGNNISGATSKFYYTKTAGTFTCQISNACDTVTSNQISITVHSIPSATITPGGPTTFCSGESVLLSVPSGANKTYQWKKGGVNIPGATLSSYNATIGGNYKVTVVNSVTGCSKTSISGTVVTLNPAPSAAITPQGPTTFCAGGSVVLSANAGTGLTYQWKKGGTNISGATLINYTATTAGVYKVKVTNGYGCSKLSTGVTVIIPCREEEELASTGFNFSVYPNPASSEINIIFSSGDNFPYEDFQGEIEIVNALGARMLKAHPQNKIDITNFSKGVYFIKMICGDHFITQKFIKE